MAMKTKSALLAALLLATTAGAASADSRTRDSMGPIKVIGMSDVELCVRETDRDQRDDAMYWCSRTIRRGESAINERAVAYLHRGVVHLKNGDRQAALEDIESSITLAPAYGDAHFNLGNVAFSQGRFQDAVAAYSKAIETGLTVPELAHHNRGKAHARLGDKARADADFAQAKTIAALYKDSPLRQADAR
ncbi:MAG TPA: tetratricopeptide repeat protein [Azospirillaceae bacterium]|nr:tetratricopeptide repeat protein [Azospirillaceae bacterium]